MKIIPCWIECMWKFLFSCKFPGNLRVGGCRSNYNYWLSLLFSCYYAWLWWRTIIQIFWYMLCWQPMVFLKNISEIWYRMQIFEKHQNMESCKTNYARFIEPKLPRVILMLEWNLTLWHIFGNISINYWPICIPIFLACSWEQALQLRHPKNVSTYLLQHERG